MKNKKKILVIIVVFLVLIFINDKAYAVTKDTAANRCVYSFTDNNLSENQRQNMVYIYTKKDDYDSGFTLNDLEIKGGGGGNHDVPPAKEALSINSGLFVIDNNKLYCPSYVYFCPTSNSDHWDGYIIKNKSSCSYNAVKIDIDKGTTRGATGIYKASEDSSGNIKICKKNTPKSIDSSTKSNIESTIDNKNYERAYSMISDLLNGVDDYCDSASMSDYLREVTNLKSKADSAVSSDTSLSQEQKNNFSDLSSQISTRLSNLNSSYSLTSFSIPSNEEVVGCDELLDEDLKQVIQLGLKWLRIIAPIILILLVALDFSQVVISNDKDAMQKAISKAVKRAIAALALFFIPLIVSIMIDWVDDSEYFNKGNTDCGDVLK